MRRGIWIYIGGRLLQSLLVLWIITTILFFLFRQAPGSPLAAYIDTTFTEEQQQALIARFGLDKPMHIQYLTYLGNLIQGDFGDSFRYRAPVTEQIMDVLPNTLYLTLTSLFIAYIIGVVGGVFLASRRGTTVEKGGIIFTLMTRAAPQFWVGMILLAIFAFELRWLPSSGTSSPGVIYRSEIQKLTSIDFWEHMLLPTFTLALFLHGLPLLLMRSNMLEVLDQDYITMGRLAGYSERFLMLRVAARNALLPIVTALALGIGYSIGGNVIIENVFAWPGLGRMLVSAVAGSDYPLAQGAFFIIAVIIVLLNFLADVLYSVLDPRVGSSSQAQGV
ncbi:MAG: ABC transporter permease [Chloroflexi bacterium]|nr:MAG: ABC transporter permease [Chloroflexota bacterium]